MGQLITSKEVLASKLGVSTSTLNKWEYLNGFPTPTPNGHDVDLVATWAVNSPDIKRHTRLKVTKLTGIESSSEELDDLDNNLDAGSSPNLERFRLARAKLAELQLAREAGELVKYDTYIEEEAARFNIFKKSLEQLSRALPPRLCNLSNAEMEVELRNSFDNLLKNLQREIK